MTKSPPNRTILPRYSLTFQHSKKPLTSEVAGLTYEKEYITYLFFKSIHIFKQLCRGILRLFTAVQSHPTNGRVSCKTEFKPFGRIP